MFEAQLAGLRSQVLFCLCLEPADALLLFYDGGGDVQGQLGHFSPRPWRREEGRGSRGEREHEERGADASAVGGVDNGGRGRSRRRRSVGASGREDPPHFKPAFW